MRTGLPTQLIIGLLALAAFAAPASAATTVWVVGDGGVPEPEDDAVADFIEGAGAFDHLFYLGDVYETGTAQEWNDYYEPSYGRFKVKTLPIPGNHDWENHAEGYDPYWGDLAPQTDGGHWYAKNIGGYQVLALNTEEPISEESPQHEWVEDRLRPLPGTCTLPLVHKPRYTASTQLPDYEDGEDENLEPLWRTLLENTPIVLTGHHHNYQRFRANRGIVQFIIGSGGRRLHALEAGDRRLAASYADGWGALRLRLGDEKIDFEFLTSEGFRLDSGTIKCESHTTATVTSPKAGRLKRPPRRLRGTTTNTEKAVRLSLVGRGPKGCVSYNGRKFKRSCRARNFRPEGVESWNRKIPKSIWLPGNYVLTVKTTGLDGHKVKRRVRFKIS